LPSPSRVAASAARIFSRRDKVLVGFLEELERVGVAFRSATEPIDASTPTGDREKPWEVRQRRLLDSLEGGRESLSSAAWTRTNSAAWTSKPRSASGAWTGTGIPWPARAARTTGTLRLGSYGEQSDVRGQDAEVACPRGHLFRDPVVYPEVIGCASRNSGSTEGVPYWRPHLRIEKELDTGTSSSTPSSTSPGTEPRTVSRRAGGERTTRGWRRPPRTPRGRCASRLAAANPVRRSRGTSGRSRRRGRR
jgi:hypothetical protein